MNNWSSRALWAVVIIVAISQIYSCRKVNKIAKDSKRSHDMVKVLKQCLLEIDDE